MNAEARLRTTRRALVADDDRMVRLLTREVLENLGVAVDEAIDGQEAIERFEQRQGKYDLVLLDLEMPRVDGFTVCASIKQLPGGEHTTVVVITGSEDHESIVRAFDAGAADFVTKPIRWPILTEHLRFILRSRDTFRELCESEHRLSEAQRIARLGSWEWNLKTNEARWSAQAYRILGTRQSEASVSYADFLDRVHPRDRAAVSTAIGDAIQEAGPFSVEHRVIASAGEPRLVQTQGMVLIGESGGPELVHGVVQDITARKEAEARIHQLAFYDELTGLPNRALFKEYAGKLLPMAARDHTKVSVIFLDLDRFRRINDSLGHAAGDAFLKAIAKRLSSCTRCSDTIAKAQASESDGFSLARLGADEFMILIGGLHREQEVTKFAQRILDSVAKPLVAQETEIFISGSIGIAVYPDDGTDIGSLMKHADTALEHAKQAGGNCFRFFSPDMNRRTQERLSLEAQLNRALENHELAVHYQAQTRLANGEVTGLEALLRWRTRDGEQISPAQFIPIAEETGLIVPIGKWVFDTVCAQMAAWREEGLALVPVAVNLSARQFEHQNLERDILRALTQFGIEPRYLELELTERVIMSDAEENRGKLQRLKALGVRIAIDDFGTGYSSLSYLKRFPLDALKIDRSFVIDLHKDSIDEGIIGAIIALAKSLKLITIAEGVETDIQRALLSRMGCDTYQGYLFARPAPAAEVARLLRARPVAAAR